MKPISLSIFFLCLGSLLLSGCGQKAVVVNPVPVETAPPAATEPPPDQPVRKAEVVHLLYTTIIHPGQGALVDPALEKQFQTPDDFHTSQTAPTPPDIKNDPFLLEIKDFLTYNFRGLTVDRNNRFHPDAPVSRAEFSLLAEDILHRKTQSPAASTRYIGSKSPFADVADDYFAFNAIITVTIKGILTPDTQGRFHPEAPITRAETHEAIDRLHKLLN